MKCKTILDKRNGLKKTLIEFRRNEKISKRLCSKAKWSKTANFGLKKKFENMVKNFLLNNITVAISKKRIRKA